MLLGLALVGDEEFSASAWREARAEQDAAHQEDLARMAIDDGAPVGRSPSELRALLGAPDRRDVRRRRWTWDLRVNAYIGPGDAGALSVQFAGSPPRVRSAAIR